MRCAPPHTSRSTHCYGSRGGTGSPCASLPGPIGRSSLPHGGPTGLTFPATRHAGPTGRRCWGCSGTNCPPGCHRSQVGGGVPIDSMLTDAVWTALDAGWRDGDMASALDAAQILRARRLEVPKGWRDLNEEDQRLQSLCAALPQSADKQREILKRLRGVEGVVARARAKHIAVALSQLEDPDVVALVLAEFPDPVSTELLRLFARDYARQPALTVRSEFRLLTAKRLPQPFRKRLEDDLRKQLTRGEAHLVRSVTVLLTDDSKAVRADWDAWLAGRTDRRGWLRR